jgi:hypothetical protein
MLAAIIRSVSDPHRAPAFLERLLPEAECTIILPAFDTNVPVSSRPWCSIVTALPCSCSSDRGGTVIALLCVYAAALPFWDGPNSNNPVPPNQVPVSRPVPLWILPEALAQAGAADNQIACYHVAAKSIVLLCKFVLLLSPHHGLGNARPCL